MARRTSIVSLGVILMTLASGCIYEDHCVPGAVRNEVGNCVRVDSGVDGAAPDAGDAMDVDAGPPSDAGPSTDAGATDADAPTFQRCSSPSECGEGVSCVSLRGEDPICRRACDTEIGDSDCPGETICMQVISGVSVVGVCTHRCTVGTSEGCPAGATCDFFSETRDGADKVFFTECRAAGTGEVCDPCTAGTASMCGGGLTCAFEEGASRCLQLCTMDSDCAEPLKCSFWSDHPTFDGVEYKRCIGEAARLCMPDGGA